MNFVFVALLGLVAILARAVALTTRGPWFSAEVSIQVYSVTMLGSVFLALALVALASFRAADLDEVMLSMEIRTSVLAQVTGIDLRTKRADHRTLLPTETIGLDDVLDGLQTSADGGSPTVRLASVTIVRVPEVSVPGCPRSVAVVQRDMANLYRSSESGRNSVWTCVLSPLILTLWLLVCSGAMLSEAVWI